jgi:hypothetical protein
MKATGFFKCFSNVFQVFFMYKLPGTCIYLYINNFEKDPFPRLWGNNSLVGLLLVVECVNIPDGLPVCTLRKDKLWQLK